MMDIVSINKRITAHQQEHSMGIAAYFILQSLIGHLEDIGVLDKNVTERIVNGLAAAVQAEADAQGAQGHKLGQELWSTVAADIADFSTSDRSQS